MRNLLRSQIMPMEQERVYELVSRHVAHVLGLCRPEEIIVFGSAISGKFDAFSDVDLVLIFGDLGTAKAASHALYATPGKPSSADYLCVDRQEFEQKSDSGGVFFVAKHDGRVVYRSSGQH